MAGKGARRDPDPEDLSVADLYSAQHEQMLRLAYLLTGDRAVAEDVVHDAFVALHTKWRTVQEPVAYLRQSVVNSSTSYHRRRFRERARFPDLVTLPVADDTVVILDAVARLPVRQQAALVLRFYEDRSEAEIAELLGCEGATVRSLVHRGLIGLRRMIDP